MTTPKANIVIRAEYAHLIQPFISTEKTRFYLNGFSVEPRRAGGVFIVATDGHKAGIYWDETGACTKPGIVKLDKATLAACKAKDHRERFLFVDGEAPTGTATVAYEGREAPIITQHNALIDGTFPDWQRIVPRLDPAAPAVAHSYNAGYLADFGRARGEAKAGLIRCFATDMAAPALVRVVGRNDFFGILMPSPNPPPVELPDWFVNQVPTKRAVE